MRAVDQKLMISLVWPIIYRLLASVRQVLSRYVIYENNLKVAGIMCISLWE